MVGGVGFDLDHTLAIDNKLERVAFLRLLELVLRDGGHTIGSLPDECDRIDALLEKQRAGAFSIDQAVRRFVTERGVAPTDAYVERFRALTLAMVDDFVIPIPGAALVLEELRRRGFAMAVLSNGWNPLQERKARRAGFKGPVLASADIGVQKPDPRAFAALMAVLATPLERTWFVGDDPVADVAGASNAGLHGVWLDAEGKTYPSNLPPPSSVAPTLEALLEILALPERVA